MRTHKHGTVIDAALLLAAVLVGGCTNPTTRMTTLPSEGSVQGRGEVPSTVVLFRIVTGNDGKGATATLSTIPKWKWHYLISVGPLGHPLDPGKAFGAGQVDTTLKDAGCGFLTLPAGAYRLAFAAYRTRFAMPDAERAALGFGQSPGVHLEVPAAATLVYVGTFDFTCHNAARWWGYVEHECTQLEVRDERELALQVASGSLSRFGPMQTALALIPTAPSSR